MGNKYLFEAVFHDISNGTFCAENYLNEGATLQSFKLVVSKDFKQTEDDMKTVWKLYHDKKFDEAITLIKKIKRTYDKISHEIASTKDTTMSNVTGFLTVLISKSLMSRKTWAKHNPFAGVVIDGDNPNFYDPDEDNERMSKIEKEWDNYNKHKDEYKTLNKAKKHLIYNLHALSTECDAFIKLCQNMKKYKHEPIKP